MDVYEKKKVMVVFRAVMMGRPVLLRGKLCSFDENGVFGYDAQLYVMEDGNQVQPEEVKVVLDWSLEEFVEAARSVRVEEFTRLLMAEPLPHHGNMGKKGNGAIARTEN